MSLAGNDISTYVLCLTSKGLILGVKIFMSLGHVYNPFCRRNLRGGLRVFNRRKGKAGRSSTPTSYARR